VESAHYRKRTDSTFDRTLSTIPLVEIVDSFDVFHTGQGSQGILERPSKQVLDTVFSSTNEQDIVQIVLEKGRIITGSTPHKFGSKNDQRYVAISLSVVHYVQLLIAFFCTDLETTNTLLEEEDLTVEDKQHLSLSFSLCKSRYESKFPKSEMIQFSLR